MTYTLEQLAPGSYDVMLGDTPVAALVREVDRSGKKRGWSVELLDEMPPAKRPTPFLAQRHMFETHAAALDWLGIHGESIADALPG